MTTATSKSLTEELDAIRTSAVIYPLTSRAFLRITGSDATRWLNGMVTNNITALGPGEGNYNFLLNSQGRIQGDCTIYREPGDGPATYLLETDASQIESIHTHLDKFVIMDDVELISSLNILGNVLAGMSVLGTHAADLIHKHLFRTNEADELNPLPAPKPGTMTYASTGRSKLGIFVQPNEGLVLVFAPPVSLLPRFDIWFQKEADLQHLRRVMKAEGVVDASDEMQEAFRILSTVPKFGVDITEKYLPQETAQTHALHFSKGCYLGQEIVERIHSRGQVHRTFSQFTLTGEMPTLPVALESNSKPAGELTSATEIDGTIYALGYARRELLETHQQLTYSGGTASPQPRLN